MKRTYVLAAALGLLALAGCASQKTRPSVAPSSSSSTTPLSFAPSHKPAPLTAAQKRALALARWVKAHPLLARRNVYFNFNRAYVHSRYEPLLRAQAKYLFAHRSARVLLEGNCDERGTVGYNLALGERRAHAVAHLLEMLGASPAQISIVSYGKERPIAHGNDPTAWAVNRRVDIVYTSDAPFGCTVALPHRIVSKASPAWVARVRGRLMRRACGG
jgi:peptidoglycan-associated lipoprotein